AHPSVRPRGGRIRRREPRRAWLMNPDRGGGNTGQNASGPRAGAPAGALTVGAGAGVISGALIDVGINHRCMKWPAGALSPGSSALFVRRSTAQRGLGAGGDHAGIYLTARERR